MDKKIGAYEAKTKLPELLRRVEAGECFTITNRGQPVAELRPVSVGLESECAAGRVVDADAGRKSAELPAASYER